MKALLWISIIYLSYLSYIDIRTKQIENRRLIPLMVFSLLFLIINETFLGSIAGFFAGGSIMFILALFTEGIGGGDVKLMAILGMILGVKGVISCFIITFILGGILALILLLKNRIFSTRYKNIPLCPIIFVSYTFLILNFLTKC